MLKKVFLIKYLVFVVIIFSFFFSWNRLINFQRNFVLQMNKHTFSNGNDWESSKNTWSFVFVFQIVKNHLARKVTLYKSVHIKYKFVLKPWFQGQCRHSRRGQLNIEMWRKKIKILLNLITVQRAIYWYAKLFFIV